MRLSRTLLVSSRKRHFAHNVPVSMTPQRANGRWTKRVQTVSCLSQEREAGKFHFTGPQEGKELCLLTVAGSYPLNTITTKSASNRNSKGKQPPQVSPAVTERSDDRSSSESLHKVKVKSLKIRA